MHTFKLKHALLIIVMVACAPVPKRVIEPNTIEPPAPSASGSEDEFVLSKENVKKTTRPNIYPVHIQAEWFTFRGKYLQKTPEEVKRRDLTIGGARPPDGFWDEQTASEAVSVWTEFCNECHGGRRSLKDALGMAAPPPQWGIGEGLFFGKKKKYVEVFDTILNGGPPAEAEGLVEMPAWEGKLSREMIWALIYFLEYQSGGVEGRFPPSLFPRKPDVLKE